MTSNVERKENDSDNDMYDMLEIYEQREYILWIMNEEKKKITGRTHTSHKIVTKITVIRTIKK